MPLKLFRSKPANPYPSLCRRKENHHAADCRRQPFATMGVYHARRRCGDRYRAKRALGGKSARCRNCAADCARRFQPRPDPHGITRLRCGVGLYRAAGDSPAAVPAGSAFRVERKRPAAADFPDQLRRHRVGRVVGLCHVTPPYSRAG